MSMQLAPISLFAYNRPWHTQQAVESLKRNELAKESALFIFLDYPFTKEAEEGFERVKSYIKHISGFKEKVIVERERNYGLSKSIIPGITEVIGRYGKIIVLEDDLVVSRYFLQYMNEALLLYEEADKVISVCGYMYPVQIKNAQTLFLRIPDCWGWATWKRGWDLFEPDGRKLLERLKNRKLLQKFDLGGSYNFTKMLNNQIEGKIDSWAIRWYASAFLQEKLSLYPWESLVKNIGLDCSGTHYGFMTGYDTGILEEPVLVERIPIAEDSLALENIRIFFKSKQRDIFGRVINKTVGFFRKR